MNLFWNQFRYGVRRLRQEPVAGVTLIAMLAIGIGGVTTMFSVVDAAFFRDIPLAGADRILMTKRVQIPITSANVPKESPTLDEVRRSQPWFDRVEAYGLGGLNLTGGEEPIRLRIAEVTPGFMPLLGVRPELGETFREEDGVIGGRHVVILSHGLWLQGFGADSAIIGRQIGLNNVAFTVIGVMPDRFSFPGDADLWRPLHVPFPLGNEAYKGSFGFVALLRVSPTASLTEARAKLTQMIVDGAGASGRTLRPSVKQVMSLRESLSAHQATTMQYLFIASVLVLFLTCASLGGIQLVRAESRRRELAIRYALGASHQRMVFQLGLECLPLVLPATVIGLGLGHLGLRMLGTLLPADLRSISPPAIDLRVAIFASGLAVATVIALALAPAFHVVKRGIQQGLKLSGNAQSTGGIRGSYRALVVGQVTIAMSLLFGAGTLLDSLRRLSSVDIGFKVTGVSSVELSTSKTTYPNAAARRALYSSILTRLNELPGVEAAAANVLPLAEDRGFSIMATPEGRPETSIFDEAMAAQWLQVTPRYFHAMSIPVLQGRGFESADEDSSSTSVIINDRMATVYWPGTDPIGKRVKVTGKWRTIIGVVGDVRSWGIDKPPMNQIYLPLMQAPQSYVAIVSRRSSNTNVLPLVLAAVRSVDPGQPVHRARPMTAILESRMGVHLARARLASLFAVFAILLAALAIHGAIDYSVTQRRREMAIRSALGASRHRLMWSVVQEGLAPALLGIVGGLSGSFALNVLLRNSVYGLSSVNANVVAGTTFSIVMVAIFAVLRPALSITRHNAVEAMRA